MRLEQRRGNRHDLVNNLLVLLQRVRELIIVRFEFVLLEEDHLCRLGRLDTHAKEALRLADELQDLTVKVDVQLRVGRVADD